MNADERISNEWREIDSEKWDTLVTRIREIARLNYLEDWEIQGQIAYELEKASQKAVTGPQWHDRPTCAGYWLKQHERPMKELGCVVFISSPHLMSAGKWFGPLPEFCK